MFNLFLWVRVVKEIVKHDQVKALEQFTQYTSVTMKRYREYSRSLWIEVAWNLPSIYSLVWSSYHHFLLFVWFWGQTTVIFACFSLLCRDRMCRDSMKTHSRHREREVTRLGFTFISESPKLYIIIIIAVVINIINCTIIQWLIVLNNLKTSKIMLSRQLRYSFLLWVL